MGLRWPRNHTLNKAILVEAGWIPYLKSKTICKRTLYFRLLSNSDYILSLFPVIKSSVAFPEVHSVPLTLSILCVIKDRSHDTEYGI